MTNSELKEFYTILPIDCDGDREFSDMLSVMKHNHIDMQYDARELSFDNLTKLVDNISLQLYIYFEK